MKQGILKTIKIDGITDKGFKLVLQSGKEKYNVWKKEFEQEVDSEAFMQYKAGNIGVGSTVEIEYSEKEKSFVGEKGENVKYTDRSIWRFLGVKEHKEFGPAPVIVEDAPPF